ncbi:BTAD domain-containing putative transcriptional regulator [Candidatus Protofrankia californiensis]|uniref:BTAD domain-containing putative transcriptional regulator n=1 Tax=Candidatus Protofrankia californiensis TaxID=1839754 RepID=UPI0010411BF3|nr:BTAD domain-containing putative transcriptional regulator [Candidatus Protofrankia californiensis]
MPTVTAIPPSRPRRVRPRTGELLAGLVAALGILGFLTAVPVAFWVWRHNPLPTTWEPTRWWTLARRGYIHPDLLPNGIAVAAWLLWAEFVLALVREAGARARRGASAGTSRIVPGRIAHLASAWITSASIVLTVLASRTGPTVPAEVLPMPAAVTAAVHTSVATTAAIHADGETFTGPSINAGHSGAAKPIVARDYQPTQAMTTYICAPYDTLRSLAAHFYGNPDLWSVIRDASIDATQPDGTHLPAGFTAVDTGTVLRIPQPDTTATTGSALIVPARASEPAGDRAPETSSHIVVSGDTLWGIATTAYNLPTDSAGPAATAIFDANKGVTDPAGHVLHDPDLINPGMTLHLPVLASDGASSTGAGTDGRAAPTAPALPDDGPGSASRTPPTRAPVTAVPTTGTPHTGAPAMPDQQDMTTGSSAVAGTRPPHTALPGSTPPGASLPGSADGPSAAAASPSAATSAPASPSATSQPPATPSADEPPITARRTFPVGWIAAGGLLAAFLAALWGSRRRRRDSTVRPGDVLSPPDPAVADVSRAVLRADDPDGTRRLDHALRLLTAPHRTDRANTAPLPQVIFRHLDDRIDVYLAAPLTSAPPPPWRPGPDPRVVVLPANADVPTPDPRLPAPCPALVQLGVTDDGAELLVDLEALGTLAVDTGPDSDLPAVARAIVATIAASPWAEITTVRTAGIDVAGFAGEERIQPASSPIDLVTAALHAAERRTTDLADSGWNTTLTARVREPDQDWDPTIAVAADPAIDDALLDQMTAAAGDGYRGLAAIVPARPDHPVRWRLTAVHADVGQRWRLDPLGITVTPLGLTADDLNDLNAFLADADPAPVAAPPPAADDHAEPFPESDWRVMIRLIGPVDLIARDGTRPAEAPRGRILELLAWLITHRHGTRTDLEAAMWPDGAHARTIGNEIGRARAVLTELAGPDAHDWIPARSAQLRIHPLVTSDLELLTARLHHARAQRDHPGIAIATLQDALDLVRGTPASYDWLVAETGSTLTTTPVQVATLLAGHHLDRGNADAVLETTARGLAILPAHTELFALRMRAHALAGDPAAVTAEYRAYQRAERADPFWDGDTDPELRALHTQLLSAATRATSTRPR